VVRPRGDDYEPPSRALQHLQRCGTVEESIAHYVRQGSAVEAWVAQAIASVPATEPRPAPAIVEETAFWRRAQQLMAAHVAG
jgi:hypothetical protein